MKGEDGAKERYRVRCGTQRRKAKSEEEPLAKGDGRTSMVRAETTSRKAVRGKKGAKEN